MPASKLDVAMLPDLARWLDLPPALSTRLAACTRAADALALLAQGGHLVEAARLCAYALPPREAVWWAAQCARHTAPADLPASDRSAHRLAEQWVRERADAVRREAMAAAEAAGFASAEAWAAVAAFWSGDSMSPPDQPKVPPAPHLPGTAVAGAVILASVRHRPERQPARLQTFLDSARDIAGGGAGRLAAEAA
jgi:hypothetical protein